MPGIVSDNNDEGGASEAWSDVDSDDSVDPGDEDDRHRAQPVNPAAAACINYVLTKLPCITRAIAALSPAAARLAIGRGRGRARGSRPAPAAGGQPRPAGALQPGPAANIAGAHFMDLYLPHPWSPCPN